MNEQKIDFNRLWNNKSVPSKILAGIGLILGGAGAGLTGGPNPALEMINKEIEHDVEEQKAQIGKKNTMLERYLQLHGDMSTASRRLVEDLQAATAAKMSEFQLKNQQMMMNGFQQGGAGQTGQFLNYLRMFNPEMAKSVESRWLPNFGTMTNLPVAEKDRNELAAMKDLDDTLSQLEQFSKQHSGSLNPQIVNAGKALAARAKDQLRQANSQGVFREAEQKFDEKLIPSDPTKFFADFRTIPQYEMTKSANRQTMINTLNKYMEGQLSTQAAQSNLTPRKTYAASTRKSTERAR